MAKKSKPSASGSSRALHPTRNDLNAAIRAKMTNLLNRQLADTLDLALQTKQAHWNVKGPSFIALHELFDQLNDELEDHIDEIAERCTALGGTALGTARVVAQASSLPEYPLDAVAGETHLKALVARYSAVAASTRASIDTASDAKDADTADLFTGISRTLDKSLWFLESHLL